MVFKKSADLAFTFQRPKPVLGNQLSQKSINGSNIIQQLWQSVTTEHLNQDFDPDKPWKV